MLGFIVRYNAHCVTLKWINIMAHNLTKNAQKIDLFLQESGLTLPIHEFAQSTRTAQEAADSLGCAVEQIAKSLIFETAETSQSVLVLASGPIRVNEKKIGAYVGRKIRKADAAFTKKVTGFTIGGIPPFAHKTPSHFTFIDEGLTQHETVWAAAGMPNSVFEIKISDLIFLTKGKLVSVQ